tara:strand:- start:254 stop:682 length:429 start_codon:yes stop_codon:yes gene_type:complete
MKKTILILPSDPHSINYEVIKKNLPFFKKINKNNYLFVGDKKGLSNYLGLKKLNLEFVDVKKKLNTRLYLKNCFEKSFEILKKKRHMELSICLLIKSFFRKNTLDLRSTFQILLEPVAKRVCFCIVKTSQSAPIQHMCGLIL